MSHDAKTIEIEQLQIKEGSLWGRIPLIAGAVGVLGVLVSALLARGNTQQFYFSWLVAFLFFLSLSLGALFFVLLHHATKAGWGVVVRRLAENTAGALPVLLLLFLPLLIGGMHDLYHWSEPEVMAHDAILKGKEGYLNIGFFSFRAFLYFAIWSGFALWYRMSSRRQDSTGDQKLSRRMAFVAGPGLALFALSVTFAAFDWIMSLDPHWYSTIFGVYYFAGCLVGIFAFLVLLTAALERAGYLENVVTSEHYHDLGKLLFAFTVFWTYIAFAQYFLIWYGNIPEETIWYLHRMEGSWRNASMALAVAHFGIPFFFLMPRTIKRNRLLIVIGALWMLAVHYLDLYWLVMPTLHHQGVQLTVLDLTTFVGVGGLALGAVTWLLRGCPVIPLRDPRILESLGFENA